MCALTSDLNVYNGRVYNPPQCKNTVWGYICIARVLFARQSKRGKMQRAIFIQSIRTKRRERGNYSLSRGKPLCTGTRVVAKKQIPRRNSFVPRSRELVDYCVINSLFTRGKKMPRSSVSLRQRTFLQEGRERKDAKSINIRIKGTKVAVVIDSADKWPSRCIDTFNPFGKKLFFSSTCAFR